MPYRDPKKVLSPKGRIHKLEVLYDGGPGSFAIARMRWDGDLSVGVRWNGGGETFEDLGNPQSRGIPTWFILPDKMAELVEANLDTLSNN